MRAYLRLLLLRTRRAFLPIAFGLPALAPTGIVLIATVFERLDPQFPRTPPSDEFLVACLAAIVAAVMVVTNLTAFLVHDERRGGRGRILRLATIDGRPPVAAHLGLAALLAATGVVVGLLAPGIYAIARGLPPTSWLGATAWAAVASTAAGALGLWMGYLLPRTVALVALQMAALWLVSVIGAGLEAFVRTHAWPFPTLAWVALAHLLTLLVLPRLWRRTSARLW